MPRRSPLRIASIAVASVALAGASALSGCLLDGDASTSSELGDGALFAEKDGKLIVFRSITKGTVQFGTLFRLDPATDTQTFVADVTELPPGAEMFLSEAGFAFHELDRFWLWDRDGKRVTDTKATDLVEGVTLSGDRGFLLGTLTKTNGKRIAVVDGATMEVHELEAIAGTVSGAALAHTSDALYVGLYETTSGKGHLLRWDLDAVKIAGFPIDPATGLFASPNLDVELGLTIPMTGEVVVSPNDKFVSVGGITSVAPHAGSGALDVVDILSGGVREIPSTQPPTTFTFDDAYVLYSNAADKGLVAVDLDDTNASLGFLGIGVSSDRYAISRTSNHYVYDWDGSVGPIPPAQGMNTKIDGDFDLGFYMSVGAKMYNLSRPIGGPSTLQILDLATGKSTSPITGDFEGMTALGGGAVVLSDLTANTLTFVDTSSDTVVKTVPIPTLK